MTQPAEVRNGLGFFPHRGLTLVRGRRATVWDDAGRAYLDAGGASYGTMNVGHAHARVAAAIVEGSGGLTHVSQTFAHPARSGFVENVRALAGPWTERVFLSNSGAEAVEAAIKVAMATTGRSGLVAFEGAFHGRTLGALSATHKGAYRAPFSGRLAQTRFAPFNDADAAAEAITRDTACVLVEVVQGEAGARAADASFLRALRDACTDAGALLVVDEVQTGIGRTGADLAIHATDIEPDVLCLAKSVAAGLPLGVTLTGPAVGPLPAGLHGSTFGGSPLACAVGSAVLDVLRDDDLSAQAAVHGACLVNALSAIASPLVREVRGRGLLVAVELSTVATPVLREMQARGVLALPAGNNAVRFLPPLALTPDEVARMGTALAEALDVVERRFAGQAVRS